MQFQYCPHCGKKAEMREIGDEGVIPYCAQCKVPLWDMFTTSIIAAVVNECGEVALLRQNYVSTTNHVCVAGVMKPGESAEDTVVREVGEELGLDVKSVSYVRSYPYEKKDMLMLGFQAVVEKKDFVLSGEVDAAEWVRFEDALSLLWEGSVAWRLVREVTGRSQERTGCFG